MIIKSHVPLRISLLGGGTDVEPFASQEGGVVVNFTITLSQHMTLYTGEDTKGKKNAFPESADPEFLLKIARLLKEPFAIESTCDAYLGSGLGSSAAAAVALISAISKSQNRSLPKSDLAQAAYLAETDMGWYGGKQDQYASVYGGWNVMEFGRGEPRITPLAPGFIEPLRESMVLFYTGKRLNTHPNTNFQEPTKKQTEALRKMKELAIGSLDYIVKADFEKLGGLLDLAWTEKKKANPLSTTPEIDTIYQHAKSFGAFGGKVCGAGSGGYMLFLIDPFQRKSFLENMARAGLQETDFGFDFNGVTCRRVT